MKTSIIITTFNQSHFIMPHILLILIQNIIDLEIITIEGLSTDSTS